MPTSIFHLARRLATATPGWAKDHGPGNDCYALLDTAEHFTRADVEYLVAEAKFIRAIPQPMELRGSKVMAIHVPDVFRKSNPHRPVKGLVIMAKARPSPPGIPKPTPSSALEFHGRRIRGLNYEQWHDNPDGTRVKGWHEHIWYAEYEDSHVVPARPKLRGKTLLDVFKWGLKKWNIEVLAEQPRLLGLD